ncbi:MAG: 30S ribosomal protein S6 [Myxococcales bacterium]|nr:30S ribosomal protein S6 [Myxococcales bacterium]
MVELQREYETVCILDPDLEEEGKLDALLERIQGVIDKSGGSYLGVEHWGKRKLAYEINKSSRGYYVINRFLGHKPALIREVERNLRIMDGVWRFLTIQVDQDVDPEVRLASAKVEQEKLDQERIAAAEAAAAEKAKAKEWTHGANEVAEVAAQAEPEQSASAEEVDGEGEEADAVEATDAPAVEAAAEASDSNEETPVEEAAVEASAAVEETSEAETSEEAEDASETKED